MRKLLLAATIFALCSTGFASDRAAMAESTGSYSIDRDGTVLSARENTLTEVRTGDLLLAGEKPVRVETAKGETILVGQNSQASFKDAGHVVLTEGTVALATPGDSTLAASYSDLLFESISGEGADRHMLLIQVENSNEVMAQSLSETFAVRSATTGEQIAVIGAGDDLIFKHVGDTWMVNARTVGQPGTDGQIEGGSEAAQDEVAQDEDDRRKAGFWILGGTLGAAAAGGAGYWIYEDLIKEGPDGGGDNGRNPSSPIAPPYTPPPSK
ncbi:hypothetical protein KQI84_05540 [bacterium]|nr:hypothetical protein [bacterium]